jgi:excisionase family DNA binding protein
MDVVIVADEHTLQDVAERFGVHYQTVYRWVRSGRLPASKIAGAYRVEDEDLQAFELERRRDGWRLSRPRFLGAAVTCARKHGAI